MTQATYLEPGHGAGFGPRLKQSREAAGLSLEQVSARLKMPVRVLGALEAGDWDMLGAPIFVRGQLRSYARLLGEPVPDSIESELQSSVEPVELVSHTHTPRYRRLAEQAGRRAIYVVLTVTLVAPVWMATRTHLASTLAPAESLDLPVASASLQPMNAHEPVLESRRPLVASMASLPEAAVKAPAQLTMQLTGDSWVEVFARDGSLIEKGLLVAGQKRSYDAGRVGRVLLGNSTAVDLRRAGESVDLAPFSRANVARFALSSDGSLAPVID
jgi:cytoskeleton protein RodZ